MINEDIWIHIVEMKSKAYYLLAKLDGKDRDRISDAIEAIDAIYFAHKEEFQ